MNRKEARKIAEEVSNKDLRIMLVNARKNIKDWTVVSNVNPILDKGAAFNILSCKGNLPEKIHILAKINMIREFGEYLPNYQKKSIQKNPAVEIKCHQTPILITSESFNKE